MRSIQNLVSFPLFALTLLLVLLPAFVALFLPIMEPDAAQYAAMTNEMIASGDWLTFTDRGADYLDKPPLVFWSAGLFFSLFGPSTFAYKLPGFIFLILALLSTYQIGKQLHSLTTARIATLMLAASVAFQIMVNDVRTDNALMGCVMLATWQGLLFFQSGRSKPLFLASLFIGFGLLAKGPLGLIVPAVALLPYALSTGTLYRLFTVRLFPAILLLFIILSPMLLGLYKQHGSHGLYFFFWEQSFGRVTGENVWKNTAGPFFFVHTFAWAFLPFTFHALAGLFRAIRFKTSLLALFGFLMPFIALSTSQFKLPHYIYIVTPFAALLAAQVFTKGYRKGWFRLAQVLTTAFVLGALVLSFYCFPQTSMALKALFTVGGLGILYAVFFLREKIHSIVMISAGASLAFLALNTTLYPQVMDRQSGSAIAFYMEENNLPFHSLYQYNVWSRSLDFYSGKSVPNFRLSEATDFPLYIYTDKEGVNYLEQRFSVVQKKAFPHMAPTRLTLGFLDPESREAKERYRYLITLDNKIND